MSAEKEKGQQEGFRIKIGNNEYILCIKIPVGEKPIYLFVSTAVGRLPEYVQPTTPPNGYEVINDRGKPVLKKK